MKLNFLVYTGETFENQIFPKSHFQKFLKHLQYVKTYIKVLTLLQTPPDLHTHRESNPDKLRRNENSITQLQTSPDCREYSSQE